MKAPLDNYLKTTSDKTDIENFEEIQVLITLLQSVMSNEEVTDKEKHAALQLLAYMEYKINVFINKAKDIENQIHN